MSAWSAAGRASTPWRPGRRARSTCAMSSTPDRDDAMARIGAIIERSFVPGTKAELTIRGEFLPLAQTPTAKRLFELYVAGRRGYRLRDRRRVHRRLRRFRLHRRRRRADDLRGRAGRRQGAQPGRVSAHRQPGAARAGLRPGDSETRAGGAVNAITRNQCQSWSCQPQPPPCQPPPYATTPPP